MATRIQTSFGSFPPQETADIPDPIVIKRFEMFGPTRFLPNPGVIQKEKPGSKVRDVNVCIALVGLTVRHRIQTDPPCYFVSGSAPKTV